MNIQGGRRTESGGQIHSPPPVCSLSGNSFSKARSIRSAKLPSFPEAFVVFAPSGSSPHVKEGKRRKVKRTDTRRRMRVREGAGGRQLLIAGGTRWKRTSEHQEEEESAGPG